MKMDIETLYLVLAAAAAAYICRSVAEICMIYREWKLERVLNHET